MHSYPYKYMWMQMSLHYKELAIAPLLWYKYDSWEHILRLFCYYYNDVFDAFCQVVTIIFVVVKITGEY